VSENGTAQESSASKRALVESPLALALFSAFVILLAIVVAAAFALSRRRRRRHQRRFDEQENHKQELPSSIISEVFVEK
jgi:heme/copper-type cytochrome/quinol oxidase subunit 2